MSCPTPLIQDPAQEGPPGPHAAALTGWLKPHLPELSGPCTLRPIDGGQSNPTWILQDAERAWVVRAKPGPSAALAPSAHAIEREYRVLQALQGSGVPVPRVRALCEDESVIGAAFYVMDFVPGRVLRDASLPGLAAANRAAHLDAANRVLARLHQLDWRALGLADFGREDGFFSRLVQRWTRQYRASTSIPITAMERLAGWLPDHIPAGADDARHTRLTHGDFRLENLMFHPDRPEVVAVLDWELSTLGHPLSDLAYQCTAWHLPAGLLRGFGDGPHRAAGIPAERDYVAHYCGRTGRALNEVLADWPFHLACNLFRLGAILAGIGARVRDGTAANSRAAEIAALAEPVAELGWAIASGRRHALAS